MVSKNSLRTDVWSTVQTYLQTTNPISTNNIFSAYNSNLVKDKGYPLVIIYPPNASYDKLTVTGELTSSEINMLFEIYHDNAKGVKQIADEVTAKLLAGRSTFAGDRLMNMQIESGDYDTWAEGNKKIHRIGFNVGFRFVA